MADLAHSPKARYYVGALLISVFTWHQSHFWGGLLAFGIAMIVEVVVTNFGGDTDYGYGD